MMAAPVAVRTPRREPAHVRRSSSPAPGMLLLWESWLRHEVRAGRLRGERLSISFNFR